MAAAPSDSWERLPTPFSITAGLSRRMQILATAGTMLALLLAALDQTIVATALPRIVSDLGGLSSYSWVFTAYMLATTVTVPLYGKLGDKYGRRPLFLFSIVLFLVGSALCGLAQDMTQLVAFRAWPWVCPPFGPWLWVCPWPWVWPGPCICP